MAKELKRNKAPSGGENNPQAPVNPPNLAPRARTPEESGIPAAEDGGIFSEIFKNILQLETGRKKKIQQVIDDAFSGKTGE